ncbi:unnamed protein product [Sphenostylis stenocarpa]|uniref:Uncharacterized protein n=1 Tax=Sphenostylis stenocarpa TaxID=92480 RepID=A0AA86T7G8_9FABA|nr:unnamed protein product [Sphenostylis stenocarpa]
MILTLQRNHCTAKVVVVLLFEGQRLGDANVISFFLPILRRRKKFVRGLDE